MHVRDFYDYLVRSRRDLWAVLRAAPDEVLSRHLIGEGLRFRSIKDLVFHIPLVEDGWLHGTVLGEPPLLVEYPGVTYAGDEGHCDDQPLEALLGYWQAVEAGTLAYLNALPPGELERKVIDPDFPDHPFTVDGVLWHAFTHEMRHAAQISLLLRTQGIAPPAMDLIFYLANR
ncbi:MAG TPA: DinB family protein [Deinococcales bacterium]|nr:DinB family protein [Deinococcales bacterium]